MTNQSDTAKGRREPAGAKFVDISDTSDAKGAFVSAEFNQQLVNMLRQRARTLFDDFVRSLGTERAILEWRKIPPPELKLSRSAPRGPRDPERHRWLLFTYRLLAQEHPGATAAALRRKCVEYVYRELGGHSVEAVETELKRLLKAEGKKSD
jgi:hypothetical protein